MPRKVFISFLGTNKYIETYYQFDDGTKSHYVHFVQEAIIDNVCKDWVETDKIFIFCTKGAIEKNWTTPNQNQYPGLNDCLNKLNLKAEHESILIDEGFTYEQINNIFNSVYEKLEDYDEIYFDVTHAFRSIPMFSTILFNFSKAMKNTIVSAIFYGAFEKLGPAYKVKDIEQEYRIAPILNLTLFTDLQKTIQAANDYKNFGKVGSIAKDLEKSSNNKINEALRILKIELQHLDEYILTNRMDEIKSGKFAKNIINVFEKAIANENIQKSQKELLQNIYNDIKNTFIPGESDKNIEAAIIWAKNHNMLQQAYTLGQEYIVSKTSEILKEKNPFEENKRFRQYISSILNLDEKNRHDLKYDLAEKYDLTNEILSYPWIMELRTSFKQLADNRNIINHAKKGTANALEKQFANFYKCIQIISNIEVQ